MPTSTNTSRLAKSAVFSGFSGIAGPVFSDKNNPLEFVVYVTPSRPVSGSRHTRPVLFLRARRGSAFEYLPENI
jgi:hypothetical protein